MFVMMHGVIWVTSLVRSKRYKETIHSPAPIPQTLKVDTVTQIEAVLGTNHVCRNPIHLLRVWQQLQNQAIGSFSQDQARPSRT